MSRHSKSDVFYGEVRSVNAALHTLRLGGPHLEPHLRADALRVLASHLNGEGKVLLSWTPGEWRDEFPTVFDVPE